MTCGRAMAISYPSRRICSIRIASCNSPRAATFTSSGEADLSILILTLTFSSFSIRSRILCIVRNLPPSFPESGELLAKKLIVNVDGSTSMRGIGSMDVGSQMVSLISTSSSPESITISPAVTSSASTNLRPSYVQTFVTLNWISLPSRTWVSRSPTLTFPRSTFPPNSLPR